ncbi:MAG: hypothetical protein JNJ85_00575 [Candidatus Kapabacteria bacterium]|nr:hypothetical protein [Candidatus Kapabacteria bacterium]
MISRFIILLVTTIFYTGSVVAQSPQSTFTIIDSMSVVALSKCFQQVITPAEFSLHFTPHASQWLFKQNQQRILKTDMRINESSTNNFNITIADCAVRYTNHASERDSLQRTIRIELRPMYGLQLQQPVILQYTDIIARTDAPLAEMPKYEFTSAPVPTQPHSTWDDIVEPLVVLTTLATVVTLLFTVRSQ